MTSFYTSCTWAIQHPFATDVIHFVAGWNPATNVWLFGNHGICCCIYLSSMTPSHPKLLPFSLCWPLFESQTWAGINASDRNVHPKPQVFSAAWRSGKNAYINSSHVKESVAVNETLLQRVKNSYRGRRSRNSDKQAARSLFLPAAALKMYESFSYNARQITKWQLCFLGPQQWFWEPVTDWRRAFLSESVQLG